MSYRFSYVHQTVEHCLRVPTPPNVTLIQRQRDCSVYAVNLPASVFALVVVDIDDPAVNSVRSFNTASLREEEIERVTSQTDHQSGYSRWWSAAAG